MTRYRSRHGRVDRKIVADTPAELNHRGCREFVFVFDYPTEVRLGQASPFKPIALVLEDDVFQREEVVALLEESEMAVIDCDNAEEALHVLRRIGDRVSLIFTDVQLSGKINGVELARFSIQCFSNVRVIVNSGLLPTGMLPQGVKFLPKPWLPLDVRREAARLHQLRRPLWQLLAQSRESTMLMHSHTAVPPNPPRTIRAVPEPEIALERLRV